MFIIISLAPVRTEYNYTISLEKAWTDLVRSRLFKQNILILEILKAVSE